MPTSVVMPALEMAQDTGKLVAWRKREGENVTKGEILLDVETDKAVVEIEALADGVLAGVKAGPGDEIPVGQTIAWILAAGESIPSDELPARTVVASAKNPLANPSPAQSRRDSRTGPNRIKISPKARRIAQERGVDLASLNGSGPDGEILVEDVLAAGSDGAAAKSESQVGGEPSVSGGSAPQALSSVAKLMAERTTQSWTTVPHFFVTREVEATGLNNAREALSASIAQSNGVKITHTDLLISVVARALEKHPRLNASWTAPAIEYHDNINIGLAMAVGDGVVTGVIRTANKTALPEIARQRKDLADRARAGRLRPDDISGATFTISNLGMYHVNAFTAIIVPPQAAILAVGEIGDRVVAVEGKPAVRPMISLTLSCDHRVADGARAAEFMQTLAAAMQNPI
ncbi:MAG TPA: dihydrolipoamide acetyltransferase family protein [Candidatus Dormibacteraeota bacterium]|nr:dihydrolipoamide acetyltransferase family protein [Candidatus Dormibacteraeota bacterium]